MEPKAIKKKKKEKSLYVKIKILSSHRVWEIELVRSLAAYISDSSDA